MPSQVPQLKLTSVLPNGQTKVAQASLKMEEGLKLYGYDWARGGSCPTPDQLDRAHGPRWYTCPLFQAVYHPAHLLAK